MPTKMFYCNLNIITVYKKHEMWRVAASLVNVVCGWVRHVGAAVECKRKHQDVPRRCKGVSPGREREREREI